MAEVEKLSANSNASEGLEVEIDIQKTILQQLHSLRMAGLTHLPKGTGQYAVDFDTVEPEQSASHQPLGSSNSVRPQQAGAVTPAEIPLTPTVSPPAFKATDTAKPDSVKPKLGTPSQANQSFSTPYGEKLGLDERVSALKVLQQEVADCTKCEILASQRTQTVFGVGSAATRLVFVGEGPGADEDRIGEPFVGAAGQLLDKIISASKLTRSEIYILNTVKCRPPANRNPSQDELANCWGYAQQQLELIQPEFICCLGSVAARTVLNTTQSLGRLRRQFHSYRNSRVLVTYHPAYLLRTPSAKKHVWEDMKLLMKEMGVDLSK